MDGCCRRGTRRRLTNQCSKSTIIRIPEVRAHAPTKSNCGPSSKFHLLPLILDSSSTSDFTVQNYQIASSQMLSQMHQPFQAQMYHGQSPDCRHTTCAYIINFERTILGRQLLQKKIKCKVKWHLKQKDFISSTRGIVLHLY